MTITPVRARPANLVATTVAAPVLEWAEAGELAGEVSRVAGSAVHVDLGGRVVALTATQVPLLPNGVTVTPADLGGRPEPGAHARLHSAGVDAGALRIRWPAPAPVWEPRLIGGPWSPAAIGVRGRAILRRLGADGSPRRVVEAMASSGIGLAADDRSARAIATLLEAMGLRDHDGVATAANELLGLGSGLTPEGDDLLAAAAATVATLGASLGMPDRERGRLVGTLAPQTRGRTTPLSQTLLALAAEARPIAPLRRLLDPDDRSWAIALEGLRSVGHSTGRVYAMGVGATIVALSPV